LLSSSNHWRVFGLKIILSVSSILIVSFCSAQRYDRNWVFGTNAGIDFNDIDSNRIFKTTADNYEATCSASDSSGTLLFYFKRTQDAVLATLHDRNGNILSEGDSVRAYHSSTSGAIVIPSKDQTKFMIFHLGYDKSVPVCPHIFCTKIFLTIVKNENGVLSVESKNNLLLNDFLFEKMAAVKHANGKDWWLMIYTETDSGSVFKKRFIRFLVSDTIISSPYFQDIQTTGVNYLDHIGQMKFSKEGNLLAFAETASKTYEIYDFNRCTGQVGFVKSGSLFGLTAQDESPYGVEFSPNEKYLFISTGYILNVGNGGTLFQINTTQLVSSPVIIGTTVYNYGQLQYAPNGKIFLAGQCTPFSIERDYFNCNQYLSVISQPDSAYPLCNFQSFSIYLGDSSKSTFGLPNMPNYNLDALSIYKADAGEEKTWCVEDTTIKGFILGVPSVEGVQYSWHPSDSLSSNNTAQPFASPSQTTMYVVTLTDTSIKYSCQSRVDSVFVEVRDCSVGIEDILQNEINIFPNPANETLTVSSGNLQFSIHHVIITDINGKRIMNFTQSSVNISLLPAGLYFLRVELTSGESVVRKIVVQ